MSNKPSFLIIDDDPDVVDITRALLEDGDYQVSDTGTLTDARAILKNGPIPGAILLDVMLPDGNGIEFCHEIRQQASLADIPIIIMTTRSYDSDRLRADKAGANGFISKPIQQTRFIEQIDRLIQDKIALTVWGVHGTLPVPGEKTVRYGGNTPCMSMEFASGPCLIFDAGSGIKALSNHLMAQAKKNIDACIFISHPHWDHINALPFFAPLYIPGNTLEIFGARHGEMGIRDLISSQMDGVFFPITVHAFAASVSFTDISEGEMDIGKIHIRTLLLNHPGNCLGYRIEYCGRSVCYITDNELYPKDSGFRNDAYVKKLTGFIHGCDILITDTTYMDDEYPAHIHWGHSPVGEVVELAHNAKVKQLFLFHHDPDQDDDAIDRKLAVAQRQLESLDSVTEVLAPVEGIRFCL